MPVPVMLDMTIEIEHTNDIRFCKCGCKGIVTGYNTNKKQPHEYIRGHNTKGERNHFWKGGRTKHSCGYILIKMPNHHRATKQGYVREAVLVLEQKLGRPLKAKEEPHHINKIKTDNHPENLIAVTNSEHCRIHHPPMSIINRQCCDCGVKEKNIGKIIWTGIRSNTPRCEKCYMRYWRRNKK
jgi:hypothetical protein